MNPQNNECVFSDDRVYRYRLWRVWNEMLPPCMFIGLNPSVADETKNDPTVRRCIQFAKDLGFGSLCMTNIFAFRETDRKKMLQTCEHPIGADNDRHLKEVYVHVRARAGMVIAAWGADGKHMARSKYVRQMLPRLYALAMTRHGEPGHPLYLKACLQPVLLEPVSRPLPAVPCA